MGRACDALLVAIPTTARPVVLPGLDRVLWQRLVLDAEVPHAEVAGIRRRRPVTVRVDLARGLALRDAGLRTVVVGAR